MAKGADFLVTLGAEPREKTTRSRSGPRKAKTKVNAEAKAGKAAASSRLTPYLVTILKRNAWQITSASVVFGLSGMVIVNAAYLQENKHPAPFFSGPKVAPITTAAIPRPREIVLDQRAVKPQPDPVVLEIQRHLAARGYYDAEIDGYLGARTRAAIGLYQRASQVFVDNEPTTGLLKHIRLSSPEPSFHAAARKRVAAASKKVEAEPNSIVFDIEPDDHIDDPERIKQIQRALSKLGFGELQDDGIAGGNTRKAIVKFQERYGLDADGAITTALLEQLTKLKQL